MSDFVEQGLILIGVILVLMVTMLVIIEVARQGVQ